MKKSLLKSFALVFILLTSACAQYDIKPSSVSGKAAEISQSEDIVLINIPSHGAIPDNIAILAGGGANSKLLRDVLQTAAQTGNDVIVVTSSNPALSRTVISSALDDDGKFTAKWLIYAGDRDYSDSLKKQVEKAGMRYGFIDLATL